MGACFCSRRLRDTQQSLALFEASQRRYQAWQAGRRVALPEVFTLLEPFVEPLVALHLRERLLDGSVFHQRYVQALYEQTVDALREFELSMSFAR
jgi:hypothetical protein